MSQSFLSFVFGRFSGGTSETPTACLLHSSFFHPLLPGGSSDISSPSRRSLHVPSATTRWRNVHRLSAYTGAFNRPRSCKAACEPEKIRSNHLDNVCGSRDKNGRKQKNSVLFKPNEIRATRQCDPHGQTSTGLLNYEKRFYRIRKQAWSPRTIEPP
jgi:hypothetical protein